LQTQLRSFALGLVSHSFSEGDSGEEISTPKDQSLTRFFACVKKG